MEQQIRLESKKKKVKYCYGPYNKSNNKEQWIRITEGCPHNCPFCYEPQEYKIFGIPLIIRNQVKVIDMNLLCKGDKAVHILYELSKKKVNRKVVYYDFVCGFDYRFITPEICLAIKAARIQRIRLAWDWFYKDQLEIKKVIDWFINAGYRSQNIMLFIICNWRITYKACCKKLDLLKFWNVMVADCYFDNQTFPNVIPIHWTDQQLKDFREKCRTHNRIVRLGVDPDIIPGNKN